MADRKFLKKTIPIVLILGIGVFVSVRGEEREVKPSGPAPAVEYRAKRTVPKSPILLSPSAWAAVFRGLAPKVDFLIKTHQVGTSYSFEIMRYCWNWKETPPIGIVGFKCKVKTEPSSTPGNWIAHSCTPGGVGVDFANGGSVTLEGGLVTSQAFVPVPEPSPLARQFLTITALQVEASIWPGLSKIQETDKTNNSATWTWE